MSDAAARALAADTGPSTYDLMTRPRQGRDEAVWAYTDAKARGASDQDALAASYQVLRPGPVTEHKGIDVNELMPGSMRVARWLRGRELEGKAALVANTTGQVLIPTDLQTDILTYARTYGTIRSLVDPVPTDRIKPRTALLGDATVAWGRAETGSTLVDANVLPGTGIDIEIHDLSSLLQIGEDLLDDTRAEELRQALVAVFGAAVADSEDAAFANGNGTTQPKGLAHADVIAAIPAGQKITAASPPTLANIRALPWRLPARWRRNAVWLLSTDAAEAVAGLVDTGGGPLWPSPGPNGGGLLGWPAYELPGLPAMTGTNAPSIIFGDIAAAYRIEQRRQMTLQELRERFVELGLVGVRLWHRVGGAVVRPAALAAYLL
jgi:HK97 family phage major capsid protein